MVFTVSNVHSMKSIPTYFWRKIFAVFGLVSFNIFALTYKYSAPNIHYFEELNPNEPIDVVFTWVNGSDPMLKRQLQQALKDLQLSDSPPEEVEDRQTANEARFREWNELKYSIRGLHQNLNWIRHIYIVVADGQVPTWLDTSHPGVSLVNHSSIFANASHLPTFNSNAIETHIHRCVLSAVIPDILHRIPGLSKRFLYFNDDMFVARPTSRATFFKNKRQHWVIQDLKSPSSNPLSARDAALSHSRSILDEINPKMSRKRRRIDSHAPTPIDKDVMEDLQQKAAKHFELTSSHHFREDNDVAVVFLYHHFALDHDVAVGTRFWWTWSNAFDIPLRNTQWLNNFLLWVTSTWDPLMFCLNDDVTDSEKFAPTFEAVQALFNNKFPNPSPFELQS
jgi:hypothetical protein